MINKKINDPDYVPQKMAVNEEGIYVTGMSLKEAVIDKYSNGDEEEIGANFIGCNCKLSIRNIWNKFHGTVL